MATKNPRQRALAGASMFIRANTEDPTKTREKLKPSSAMRARLSALLWGWKMEVR